MSVVLYYYPGNESSERAVDLAARIPGHVECIDISTSRELPEYVDGVPFLVVDDDTDYRGTAAIRKLRQMRQDTSSANAGAELSNDDLVGGSLAGSGMATTEFKVRKIDDSSVARYMSKRAKLSVPRRK
jgi:hypothetical protein